MPQYLLSVIYTEPEPPPPDVLEQIDKDVRAFDDELKREGAWVFAGGLHPPHTSTVVRAEDGEVLTTDGPFTETKEVVGGLSIIDADDLDTALAWAAKAATAARCPIEVRPFMDGFDD